MGTDTNYVKRGSWSTLTLSHAHEVCQKTSATLDKRPAKVKSCHQGLAYHYLQVGPCQGQGWREGLWGEHQFETQLYHRLTWKVVSFRPWFTH